MVEKKEEERLAKLASIEDQLHMEQGYKVFKQVLVDKSKTDKRDQRNTFIIKKFITEIKRFNDKREKTISEARYSIVEHK